MRARFRLAWVVVVAVGVAIRLGLLLQWPRRLNGDESLVALMGLHALRGDFPVFFYGQAYMGAPEAYASAVVYALAGPSALAAKVVPFLLSCAFIAVTGLVGHRLAGAPGGVLAALLVAVAPPFLPLYGNYAMLGYVETLVLGTLVLLLAFDVVTDERGGGRRGRTFLVLGFLAGVGWWVNPLVLSYLAAAGLFLLLGGRLRSRAAWWTLAPGFVLGSL
ncbi:MAG TPA: hypothetical protein VJB36_12940, partial [Methylomirabilota bacterium]|nr:hypothetical protein [Methylomirabilota bacterium]